MKRIVLALEEARKTSSRIAKIAAISGAFVMISYEGDDALRVAVRLALGQAFAPQDARTTGTGWRLISAALGAATGASDSEIVEAARRLGDLGDATFEILSSRPEIPDDGAREEGLSLLEVRELWDALARTSSRGHKSRFLITAFSRATPLEAKYLVKTLLGEVRTGAQEGIVLAAIAEAFHVDLDSLRRAFALVVDAAETAVLAHSNQLQNAHIKPGAPALPMLALPMESSKAPIDWSRVVCEDKLDGIRAQVHVAKGIVSIFGRGQGAITASFPDVAQKFAKPSPDVVLDGEIVATTKDGEIRPFQALQARLGRVAPDREVLEATPAAFVAFDLLYADRESYIDRVLKERRAKLEQLAHEFGWAINAQKSIADEEALDAAFAETRERGHEGLMLKRMDSLYEAGSRGAAWLKVKRATATLDVVVTAVEQGHGKRAGVLSDYTFAVWQADTLVEVGKAYSGLTDAEISELGEHFERTTLEHNGGYRTVTPTIVLEVGFDGVQRSKRHSSGFALRFPRILRIRNDKKIEEADTIAAVERILKAQIATGHREEVVPFVKSKIVRKPKANSDNQLSLFGKDDD